jgi:hypothetical protein
MHLRWFGLPDLLWMGFVVEGWGNRSDAGMGVE